MVPDILRVVDDVPHEECVQEVEEQIPVNTNIDIRNEKRSLQRSSTRRGQRSNGAPRICGVKETISTVFPTKVSGKAI